jgi:hypothetical protein
LRPSLGRAAAQLEALGGNNIDRVKPIRQQLFERFPHFVRGRAPDEDLADALYALLWSIDKDVSVDGWALFRVVRESTQELDAVGLMTLLPSGAAPIAVSLREQAGGFAWSMRIGRLDAPWLALSPDKQWNSVYLYATGAGESPPWTWGPQYDGSVQDTTT